MSVIRIFDKMGTPLEEIETDTTRSWVLNDAGRCTFSLSTSDRKCRSDILQFGNWVYIQHVPSKNFNGGTRGTLPDWVGMLLPPRLYNLGIINFTAFSAEQYLYYRPMPFEDVTGTPGTIFRRLLANAASYGGLKVQAGDVYDSGTSSLRSLRMSALEEMKQLAKVYGINFDVQPVITANGMLTLVANMYDSKGYDTNVLLTDGDEGNLELQSPILQEQGEIINDVIGYNNAQTPATRVRYEQLDNNSISQYGRLARNLVVPTQTETDVISGVRNALYDKRYPYFSSSIYALDKNDLFSYLNVGNTFPYQIFTGGFFYGETMFSGSIRALALEYNDITNKVKITANIKSN